MRPEDRQVALDSFEKVWTTVRDKHWDKKPGGLDWQAIHDEYRPQAEAAKTLDDARRVMREMLGRLKQTHFGIIPSSAYDDVEVARGSGNSGIDVRVLNGEVIITRIDPGSPAQAAGVKPGWRITSAGGSTLAPIIERLRSAKVSELILTRNILARLSGPIGSSAVVGFEDASSTPIPLELKLTAPRGRPSRFGNLPEEYVWFESRKIGNAGYITFNIFLDVQHVMDDFAGAITDFKNCNGLIIDLRGNPGGIGGMAMGMAGYLIDRSGLRLGTMHMRETTLNFVVNPRLETFDGPVAVLLDGTSASTSEILAGGLKDLGRARIFGTRSAAAALPSIFEKLPDGDGFQYAIANYISEGGKPLEGLGVEPDTEVTLTRQGLLQGHDAVLEAALGWVVRAADQHR